MCERTYFDAQAVSTGTFDIALIVMTYVKLWKECILKKKHSFDYNV